MIWGWLLIPHLAFGKHAGHLEWDAELQPPRLSFPPPVTFQNNNNTEGMGLCGACSCHPAAVPHGSGHRCATAWGRPQKVPETLCYTSIQTLILSPIPTLKPTLKLTPTLIPTPNPKPALTPTLRPIPKLTLTPAIDLTLTPILILTPALNHSPNCNPHPDPNCNCTPNSNPHHKPNLNPNPHLNPYTHS